jgi:Asp-tRNA(Asn)/Glu-tRNA(Gln) amidotransferase A subunit family amidase
MAPEPIAALAQRLAATGGVAALRDTCLARIAADDHQWHAMRATDCDAGVMPGVTGGALYGVPIVVKDNIDVAGMPTTSGCQALARALPLRDATVVARLRAAGAVLLGKTNMSELSFEIRSRSSLGGDVLCPFDPATTAGGSSGGAAVAVARGYAMAALGSDTGGSIRIPAAINGLVGFRPAHGALPMAGVAPLAPSTDTIGPIARCVADALHVYQALGGEVAPSTGSLSGIRIGVVRQAFGDDPRVLAAMELACDRLRRAGANVDDFAIADIDGHLQGTHIVDVEFGAAFDAYLARNFVAGTAPGSLADLIASGAFLPEYDALLRRRLATDPMDARAVLARHAGLRDALQRAMADAGVECLIYPTLRVVPDSLDNPKGGWAAELAARTGWPAISVPVTAAAGARPIGAELLMRAGDEARLFALATVLETA